MSFITTEASIVKFKREQLFPISDDLSIPLLRLMAATNDVRQLQKLVLDLSAAEPGPTHTERLIYQGELNYFVRLFCAHLFEAGNVFRNLDSTCKNQVDTILKNDSEGMELIKKLRTIYNDESMTGLRETLYKIRNVAASHYEIKGFTDSLTKQPDEALLTLVRFSGMSRYTIADEIQYRIVIDACRGSVKDYEEKVSQAISLAGFLSETVDHLLLALSKEREKAILLHAQETVRVPDFRGLSRVISI